MLQPRSQASLTHRAPAGQLLGTARARTLVAHALGPVAATSLALAAVACGGLKVGDHTLVAPVEGPAIESPHVPRTSSGGDDDRYPHWSVESDDGTYDSEHGEELQAEVAWARAHRDEGCFVGTKAHHVMGPSDGPVDPRLAVDGDRPRVVPHETRPRVYVGGGERCDASLDHCLQDCAWLVSRAPAAGELPVATQFIATRSGFESTQRVDGHVVKLGAGDAYQAYRSLPVTRTNVAPGTLVLVNGDWLGREAVWQLGEVESIDWYAGSLQLRDHRPGNFALSHARVAVLRYVPGGRVEYVNGFGPDRLAIAPDELILER